MDKDLLEILHLGEKESESWKLAQLELYNETHGSFNLENHNRVRHFPIDTNYSGYCFFVDGSGKMAASFPAKDGIVQHQMEGRQLWELPIS